MTDEEKPDLLGFCNLPGGGTVAEGRTVEVSGQCYYCNLGSLMYVGQPPCRQYGEMPSFKPDDGYQARKARGLVS